MLKNISLHDSEVPQPKSYLITTHKHGETEIYDRLMKKSSKC